MWLLEGHRFRSKEEHVSRSWWHDTMSKESRARAREELKRAPQGPLLLANERALLPGEEGEEPDGLLGYL